MLSFLNSLNINPSKYNSETVLIRINQILKIYKMLLGVDIMFLPINGLENGVITSQLIYRKIIMNISKLLEIKIDYKSNFI